MPFTSCPVQVRHVCFLKNPNQLDRICSMHTTDPAAFSRPKRLSYTVFQEHQRMEVELYLNRTGPQPGLSQPKCVICMRVRNLLWKARSIHDSGRELIVPSHMTKHLGAHAFLWQYNAVSIAFCNSYRTHSFPIFFNPNGKFCKIKIWVAPYSSERRPVVLVLAVLYLWCSPLHHSEPRSPSTKTLSDLCHRG